MQAVGDGTGVKPMYEMQMELKHLPFLQPAPERFMRHITAAESCGRPPVTMQRVERVRTLLAKLGSCQHNGFPVMSTTPEGCAVAVCAACAFL
jgi:chloride channel 7